MSELGDETKLGIRLARKDERRIMLEKIRSLDRDYDQLYLWTCDAGSQLGAAQAVGRRMALADLKDWLETADKAAELVLDHSIPCPKCGGSGGGDDPALRCNRCAGNGRIVLPKGGSSTAPPKQDR